MASATGRFEVASGSEDTYHEREGDPKLTRATGTQRFAGDIEGEGSVEWVMCYLPDGTARFAGLQRVEGSIGERTGSFVMESVGGQLKSSLDLPTPDGCLWEREDVLCWLSSARRIAGRPSARELPAMS